jgi:hypothetical protein
MHLLLRRSQRDDGWLFSSIMFLLDARLDLTPEEEELFINYQLAEVVVYDSDQRVQHAYNADRHFQAAAEPMAKLPWEPSLGQLANAFGEIAASLWNTAAGATYAIASTFSLSITLGSLARGQHFESEELEEILTVENNIREAVEYLGNYLRVAVTFDGYEDLSEH